MRIPSPRVQSERRTPRPTTPARAARSDRVGLVCLAGLSAVLAFAAPAAAQDFPTRPVTLVVGFAPGGASDIIARQVAAKLTPRLGQNVVVSNRAGAGGTVAAGYVANAEPDGYTLLFASASALAISPWLNKRLPYDTAKSFTPVAELVRGYYILSAAPGSPFRSVADIGAWGKSNPDKLTCGSAGPGTIHHLSCELLAQSLGTPLTHVPYKGSAPAFTALMGGEIHVMFESVPTPVPMVQDGRIRGLAVSGPRRLATLPDVPTFTEQGIRGVDPRFWFGIVAPAGTPAAAITRLNREINAVLKDPELAAFLAKQSVEAASGTADDFGQVIRDETRTWGDVVKAAGIRIE